MSQFAKNILSIFIAIILCTMCFFFGQCSINTENKQLRNTVNDLKTTIIESEQEHQRFGELLAAAETELNKFRDYQSAAETELNEYRNTIKRNEEITNRLESNQTEAETTINKALQTVKEIKELIISENGD